MNNNPTLDNETFKQITAAALRTLAGEKDLEVTYSAAEKPVGKAPLGGHPRLPEPGHNLPPAEKRLLRGCADAQALYIAHHDEALHRRLSLRDAQAQEAFNALEQARCEALGMARMRGVAGNLSAVLDEKCKRAGFDTLTSKDQAQLGDALHVLARLALSGEDAPHSADTLVKLWEPTLQSSQVQTTLTVLKDNLHDQRVFAAQAMQLLETLDMPVDGRGDNPGEDGEETESAPQADQPQDQEQDEDGEEQAGEESSAEAGMDDTYEGDDKPQDIDGPGDDMGEMNDVPDDYGQEQSDPALQKRKDFLEGARGRYHVYTTQFDEEIDAAELADPGELTRLRQMLDTQLSAHQAIITKLANRLQRKVMAQQRRSWEFGLDEGILDPSRLARIIANPTVPVQYKAEKETNFRDTVVTILIDNSGSMRGRPIALAAMSADIISRTLERCGVGSEILGFTTRAWKGGKARELWMDQGRPPEPGRLNDIRHIIYKAADAPMRRTRKNLGLMLKEGILKENIDGEALVWAYNRLARRPEARKILMVISDGAPVDDSTLSVNPSNILEADLRNVIGWIEEKSDIEISAIGIGHDVTRYYTRAMTIADADELAKALIGQLEGLFEESK
ncbi:MAG TPA: cobaltochelatase subunit CobT [Alphaproteobacteria bacterium]|nr:cobaltochelatase subunit CobT [Alphaproteobacteria bacterium]USO06392.1 MAG: cobaltochelatase subunit CobT [Rhodospirillales bacterium]HOO82511.1 cobaltochelatase subunit CobT [Alphaproteobacteria bacterium]